jgi:O-acetyl-ADP-ribose deacetylase (regulator of RNase III)
MRVQIHRSTLELVQGDITRQDTGAIVNAANPSLLGGGGIDGAIHRAGGPAILDACRGLGGCPTGDAKLTTGGRLPARYVIHAVGPVYVREGDEAPALLASAYRRSLEVACEHGIRTIAFPSISTGFYGYPLPRAAPIALRTTIRFLKAHPEIELVRFVLYTPDAYHAYAQALQTLLPGA